MGAEVSWWAKPESVAWCLSSSVLVAFSYGSCYRANMVFVQDRKIRRTTSSTGFDIRRRLIFHANRLPDDETGSLLYLLEYPAYINSDYPKTEH